MTQETDRRAAVPVLLCIGDTGMDLVIRVPRLPGQDEKIAGRPVARCPGGMAANVAVGARRLGTATRVLSVLGDDAMARDVRADLSAEGLDLAHLVTRAGEETFFCVILLDESGEKALVRAETGVFLPKPSDLTPEAFAGVGHVHLIFTEPALWQACARHARQAGATLSLDLEPADLPGDDDALRRIVEGVDILFLGTEAREAVETRLGPLAPASRRMVVTTRGGNGAELLTEGGSVAVPGHAVPVLDTLGAGDAFAAAFLHAWLAGEAGAEALAFANAAGALATGAYGAQTAMPRADAIRDLLATTRPEVHHA